jgi:hypothetical protein
MIVVSILHETGAGGMPLTKDSKYTIFVLQDHDRLFTYIYIDSTELILD